MNSNHTNRPVSDSRHPVTSPRGLRAQVAKQIKDAGSVACSTRERLRTPICAAATCAGLALGFGGLAVPSAQAAFGIEPGSFKVTALNKDGSTDLQAGSHPYAFQVSFALNHDAGGAEEGAIRDAIVDLPPGLVGNPLALPRCSRAEFEGQQAQCSGESQLGILHTGAFSETTQSVYDLLPPPGFPALLGASAVGFNALQSASLLTADGYRVSVATDNIPVGPIRFARETIWGLPSDPGHDPERTCLGTQSDGSRHFIHGCSASARPPFLTLPTSCGEPLETTLAVDSKEEPGLFGPGREATALSRDAAANPVGLTGCDSVPFSPKLLAAPTTNLASNPSGLGFELQLPQAGLTEPGAIAESEPQKTEVILPQGMTINPSAAEGVDVCSEAQLAAESLESAPGAGCPSASKIASVEVHSPLIEEPVEGAVYLAQPYQNQFHSLLAIYIVARAPQRGIFVKLPGQVTPDPQTGQLVTTFENLPPVPYSSFRLHFTEGPRAQLVTPPACGTYQIEANFTPFSDPGHPTTATSAFQVEHGADGGPCPSGGLPPFYPGLLAGSTNNAAGRYSPFYLRLTRNDTEQEITHFSIKLPPGLVAKLAGIPYCPDAAIAAAQARTGPQGGAEELASPSCPAASEVGHTLVGAGVGGALTYVPGKVYLAGPYHGAPLSVVAITAAKAGPFDLGTVVVRQALRVNPETGEVFIDATGSDPLPHIIQGIPVHLRDVRVYVDRPEFTLNPTSCARTSTASTVLGSGLDFVSAADDNPLVVTSPFQAADCASLPFKPKLSLTLKGSTRRGGNPALQAHLAMNGIGEAGLAYAQVALPPTEFLDNAHIGTVCTRVIFKEGAQEGEKCPPGSLIGHAKALTPILAEALEGPIYLRSNPERELPDIAASLHGQEINVVAVGHTDSAPGGGLRNTFEVVPDAPITSVDIDLFGGHRGLLENAPKGSATSICGTGLKATVKLKGHNGKVSNSKTPIKASCPKHKKHKRHRHRVG